MTDWQPTATMETLRQRARLLSLIRAFFDGAGALEVDVPVLADTGVTDLHIDCLQTRVNGRVQYLQSSPEYYMKRLLAAGSGSIYFLGRAFRDGESGRRHNPEFTLLEWYRQGWDEHQLMAELASLVTALEPAWGVDKYRYTDLFKRATGLDPHSAPLADIRDCASSLADTTFHGDERSTCLDLIFSLAVEPSLPQGLVLVHDYPACQAALARLGRDEDGNPVARRFEAFLNRMELANGYFELTDPAEQRRRFEADLTLRKAAGKPPVPCDEYLLSALEAGLPPCAGVALGVDRLLMQWLGLGNIRDVLPFAPAEGGHD